MRQSKFMKKEIAYKPNTVVIENLPFSIVLYPSFYGVFFGFREKENSPIVLCSCARKAIINYIKLRLVQPGTLFTCPDMMHFSDSKDFPRMFILDSADFPVALVKHLIQSNAPNDKRVFNYLEFKDNLCHECNKKIPVYRYCDEMYGGIFRQTYGWYIQKAYFEFGIDTFLLNYLEDVCPEELKEMLKKIKEAKDKYIEGNREWEYLPLGGHRDPNKWHEISDLRSIYEKLKRSLDNTIENYVRRKFGFKNVGEAWVSETLLFHIVKELFPNLKVYFHYKSDWLEGLELDIFIEELNIGIEYQGIQHFKPMKHWGGENSYNNLKIRDDKKEEICHRHGVTLIYCRYDEDLSKESVIQKLNISEK